MKLRYNAPTTLTFTFICAIILALNTFVFPSLTVTWFSAPGHGQFQTGSARDYIRLVTHVIGHADLNHFISNFSFLLLLGPILEASYGSLTLLVMMVITALVTGVLNVLLFPTGLMGASGIVFMMILLASFTNFNKGEIPLTFILIMILYLGREILASFQHNSVSEFAHIIGGLCGSLFGYFKPARR
jgi:rhomboid protease GluP